MAVSLAEKLGKRGLVAMSLHPGVIATHIENHIDWSVESKVIGRISALFLELLSIRQGLLPISDYRTPRRDSWGLLSTLREVR